MVIKAGPGGYLGAEAEVRLNGHRLNGVRGISFDLHPCNFAEARILIRVDDVTCEEAEIAMIMEAVNAEIRDAL